MKTVIKKEQRRRYGNKLARMIDLMRASNQTRACIFRACDVEIKSFEDDGLAQELGAFVRNYYYNSKEIK